MDTAPLILTVTSTLPDVDAEGDVTVIVVVLINMRFVAGKLSKKTVVVFDVNPVPYIIMDVPPSTAPFVGERLVRVGFP